MAYTTLNDLAQISPAEVAVTPVTAIAPVTATPVVVVAAVAEDKGYFSQIGSFVKNAPLWQIALAGAVAGGVAYVANKMLTCNDRGR